MNLDEAVGHMLRVRGDLRSKRGVTDPLFISENMQRLTQYTGAVEEHLAVLEEELDLQEMHIFTGYMKQGKSASAAETLTRFEVGETKGSVARIKRLVNSSWSIIKTSQSRYNHLSEEYKQGGRAV